MEENDKQLDSISWKDNYYSDSTRTVLTTAQLHIPGLEMFGRHVMASAFPPLPLHYHKNCFELTFVINGNINYWVGSRQYLASGYDVFITRPNEIHSTNYEPVSIGEIIWFQLDISDPEHLLFLDTEASLRLFHSLSSLTHYTLNVSGTSILRHIQRAFELTAAQNNQYRIASILHFLLWELIEIDQHSISQTTPDIESALLYIKEHITQELSMNELADVASLSVSQFKQKFKLQVGISPRNYINFNKIKAAKKSLLQNIPITKVAMDLGFNSSSYFSTVFKRYTACSPSEYIKHKQLKIPDCYEINMTDGK